MFLAVSQLVMEPSVGMLSLLKYLLFLVFLFHIPYMACVIGGTVLSLLYSLLDKDRSNNPHFLRFSQDVAEKGIGNFWVALLLGILPLVTATLLFYQYLYDTPLIQPTSFWGEIPFDKWAVDAPHYAYQWWIAVGAVALGLLFLLGYKKSFASRKDHFGRHIFLGLSGLGLVLLGWLIFCAQTTFLLYPTMWELLDNPIQLIFGSVLLSRFGYFLHVCLAFGMAGLLFHFFYRHQANPKGVTFLAVSTAVVVLPLLLWYLHGLETGGWTLEQAGFLLGGAFVVYLLLAKGAKAFGYEEVQISDEEKAYRAFVRKVLFGFGLAFTIMLPAPAFLDYIFLEEAAFSDAVVVVYFVAVLGMLFLAWAYLSGLFHLEGNKENWIVPVSCTLPLFFVLVGSTTELTALQEQIQHLHNLAEKAAPKEVPATGILAKLSEKGRKGFTIFKSKCLACHSVDGTRVVGPTFKGLWNKKNHEVTTSGKERKITVDEQYIKDAILNPNKDIVKGFPAAMPPQPLSDGEVQEFIEFLKDLIKLSDGELKELQAEARK